MTIERDYGAGTMPVEFFTGVEVEHSPAHGMPTLFVVGHHAPEKVIEKITPDIKHVYFGANMSFNLANDDAHGWRDWEWMIETVLDKTGISYATLDLSPDQLNGFLDGALSDSNRVIPMISVKLPYTRLLNYNTTIKIDDKGFDATNPGVWCHPLHDLMDRKCFTPWSAYKGDNPVNN